MLSFPIPYSLFPIPFPALLGTRRNNATALPNPLTRMCQAGREARKWARRSADKKPVVAGEARKNSLKLNERSGNIYENKRALWKNGELSWYVYENKSTYPLKAGILLKIKDLV